MKTETRIAVAYDRGDADAYYGRPFRPRLYTEEGGFKVDFNLSPDELHAYRKGWQENPSGEKDWGHK